MVSTRQITGSKDQIVEQIQHLPGRVLSAIVVVDDPSIPDQAPLTEAEFLKLWTEMQADTVSVPHANDSREAIYTRMPGE